MSEEIAADVIEQQPVVENTQVEEQQTQEPEQQPGETNQDYEQRLRSADNLIRKLKFQRKEEQRQRTEYEKQLSEVKKELETLKAPKAPKEDDFDNYGDFVVARAVYEAKQGIQQPGQEQLTQEQALELARQQIQFEQRQMSVAQQATELSSKIPDYVQVHTANLDILEELPPHASQAILEAENGALAFYTLAKQGQLEQLASMNPIQAAMAVARAEAQGQRYLTKPTTQAPPPMKGLKGASSVPSEDELSGKELLKKFGQT